MSTIVTLRHAERRVLSLSRALRCFSTTPAPPAAAGGGSFLGRATMGVAASLTVGAVAFLPQFGGTREGITRGLAAEAHTSDHIEFWMLQGMGGILGALGGFQLAQELLRKLVSEGRTGMAWVRLPISAAGGVMFAVLGKELAQPAATMGLKVGKMASWGMDGLQADIFGRPDGKLPAWEADAKWTDMIFGRPGRQGEVPAEVPPEPLAETADRMREIEVGRAEVSELHKSGAISEDEATERNRAHDDNAASTAERDARLREMGQKLCRLRSEKASLKKSLLLVRAEGATGAREYAKRLKRNNDAMKSLKKKATEEYGVSLGRVVKEEVKGRSQQLEFLRVEQLRIRGLLLDRVGYAERRDLSQEFERLDKAKKQLKGYVAAHYGEKLSKHCKAIPKRP